MEKTQGTGKSPAGDVEEGEHYRKLQWTVKGIDPVVRELSRKAAEKKGMRVNSWVELKLREAAEEELHGRAARDAQADVINKLEENAHLLRSMQQDLHVLQRGMLERLVGK